MSEAWGQLVSTTDIATDPITINTSRFEIGRNKRCHLCLCENPLLSSIHCVIERNTSLVEDDSTLAWITDTSTNGTLLNKKMRLIRNEKYGLQHGDEIFLVFAKSKSYYNVSYLFQDVNTLHVEGLEGSNSSSLFNRTQPLEEYEAVEEVVRIDDEESPSKKAKLSDTPQANVSEQGPTTSSAIDPMEESLLCTVCQEIMHDCVSLQPCMHSFCAGCYSPWMAKSRECPSCRNNVDRIGKNHIVNNLVDAYLKMHPEKKRPDEELKLLDDQNKISRDMLYPKHQRTDDDDGSQGSYDDDDDDDDDGDTGLVVFNLFSGVPMPQLGVCRQCPGYAPSTASCVVAAQYECDATNPRHVMCNCCYQMMPDRRQDNSAPSQQCCVCDRFYCHMYWSCQKPGCRGCLNKFKDIEFDEMVLNGIILDNDYESNILKDFLRNSNISLKDMLSGCLTKVDGGEYKCSDKTRTNTDLSSESVICYNCAQRNLKDLCYQYRREIPPDQLPREVTSRKDCWWGRSCRTQKCKPLHARNLNHVCEQTRFQ